MNYDIFSQFKNKLAIAQGACKSPDWTALEVITRSDRLNIPLIYEFYVTFLKYLRSNKQSYHISSFKLGTNVVPSSV